MQELRLVAVSEDGSYAILAVPGRSGRFLLPIDERLRTVAKGQFSRLAQYEIEVENPLRPKEIQDRIRAGETADEIADAAGIPPDRIRRFEGPVLAERQYRAQEAQRATIRGRSDSGPGPRLGDIVAERLTRSRRQRGQRRVGFSQTARRQLAGTAPVHRGRSVRVGRVDLRPAPPACHPGRRPGGPAMPAAGGMGRRDAGRAEQGDGNGHADRITPARPVRRSGT